MHSLPDESNTNPLVVNTLYEAMMSTLEKTVPNGASQADVLSAIFTLLDHMLRVARKIELPENAEYNSKEITRVLTDMLLEFGHATLH